MPAFLKGASDGLEQVQELPWQGRVVLWRMVLGEKEERIHVIGYKLTEEYPSDGLLLFDYQSVPEQDMEGVKTALSCQNVSFVP
ncbi:MAG: hypothetical protein Q8P39_00755 [Candidatus Yanofskybacteria bacterium]|nr:hypothetical protein [Candidatus Yanofskybacteria bacterium]